mmetsp:Transcript_23745/g.42473  ORF Transcript_23745/g.42473 Transcript_23745/m.42473 type:complete len:327 (+) Transcript_23745:885-1865(+)
MSPMKSSTLFASSSPSSTLVMGAFLGGFFLESLLAFFSFSVGLGAGFLEDSSFDGFSFDGSASSSTGAAFFSTFFDFFLEVVACAPKKAAAVVGLPFFALLPLLVDTADAVFPPLDLLPPLSLLPLPLPPLAAAAPVCTMRPLFSRRTTLSPSSFSSHNSGAGKILKSPNISNSSPWCPWSNLSRCVASAFSWAATSCSRMEEEEEEAALLLFSPLVVVVVGLPFSSTSSSSPSIAASSSSEEITNAMEKGRPSLTALVLLVLQLLSATSSMRPLLRDTIRTTRYFLSPSSSLLHDCSTTSSNMERATPRFTVNSSMIYRRVMHSR